MEIALECGLAYPTAFRMVTTLQHDGWIEAEPGRKRYRPTERVWSLVSGFQTQDLLVACARDHIVSLTSSVLWPVTISVRVGSWMMVKDSTHTMTSQTFANYYPGYTLPITDCAAGKVYLAFCPEDERQLFLEAMKVNPDPQVRWAFQIFSDPKFLRKIRDQGYASHARLTHTDNPGKTSAIAVPVFAGEDLEASLALVYFDKAMSEKEAVAKYLDPLQGTARKIMDDMNMRLSQVQGQTD